MTALDSLFTEADEKGVWDTGPARAEVAALRGGLATVTEERLAAIDVIHRVESVVWSLESDHQTQYDSCVDLPGRIGALVNGLRADLARERERAKKAEREREASVLDRERRCDELAAESFAKIRQVKVELRATEERLAAATAERNEARTKDYASVVAERDSLRSMLDDIVGGLPHCKHRSAEWDGCRRVARWGYSAQEPDWCDEHRAINDGARREARWAKPGERARMALAGGAR